MSMGMSIGVRAGSARVGVVPTASGRRPSSSGCAIQDKDGADSDSDCDYEGDGDDNKDRRRQPNASENANNSNKSMSTTAATATSNFLQIPVKNSELKEKLRAMGAAKRPTAASSVSTTGSAGTASTVGSGTRASLVLPSQRRKQEQRERRRSSVLMSLAMLDVTDDDENDHLDTSSRHANGGNCGDSASASQAHEKAHVGAPLQPSEPKGRYLRRGSVTKHRLQANDEAMQPSLHAPRDSSHNTHPSRSDLPARVDCEQYENDFSATGYTSDSYGYASDTSVSNAHSQSAMSNKRRQSSAATLGNATVPHASVLSRPPLSSSASFSQSTDAFPPRQKYNRRGSVTKFSLDSYLQNPKHTSGLQGEGKYSSGNVDYGYNDDNDNGSVASMPPLSSSASNSQSSDPLPPPRQKYNRRGSVTKFSLDSYLQNPTQTKDLQGDGKQSSNDIDYGYNDDNDNGSVVSMPPLSSSASYSQSKDALPPRQKYHRRGSVTKFSLDSYLQNPTHTKGLQGDGKQSSNNIDYGYNDDNDDNGSVASMPPLSSSASYSQSKDALPPRQKYHRRGSVTKFSLDPSQANLNNAASLQPSDVSPTNQVASSLSPFTAKHDHIHSDIDSDSDSENDTRTKPKPKPGDDDYSENLENSGRFSRRSISISMETDDIQSNAFADSNRPPLPRVHSASSAISGKKPPKKNLRDGKSEVTSDANHVKIRMTIDPQTPSRPTSKFKSALEDDSGHIKKSWYSQTPVTRRDSMSSLDSENSDTEFSSEIVASQRKQRSPPRLTPQKVRVEASGQNDDTSSPPRRPTSGKTTIDGNLGNLSSSSFDDITSNSGHSGDEDANALPTRKKPLRARRSSIVGIPSSDDGCSSQDDSSLSKIDQEEGLPTPTPTKLRARRASIVGIPTIDPPSPPSNQLSTDDATETLSKTKPSSSGNQEIAKTKKKAVTKSKSSTKGKKSLPTIASNSSVTNATSERRGCLKSGDVTCAPKKVRFGHLVITEFPIILGDNPAVTSGAPVTIDWTPQKETRLSINAYEQCKPRRRRRRKLLISVSNRAILLLAAGYSIDEIADASIDAQQIKLGRQQTLDNQSWDRINHMIETTGDAIGGIFLQPLQITGKKLKSLVVKPQQHSASARMA